MRRLIRLYHRLRLIPHVNLPAQETGCTQEPLVTMVYQVPEVLQSHRVVSPWRMGVLTTFQLEPVPFPFLDLLPPEDPLLLPLEDHQGHPLTTY